MVDQLEGDILPGITSVAANTPQKNANKKKFKGVDGDAVENLKGQQNNEISASSREGDDRTQ